MTDPQHGTSTGSSGGADSPPADAPRGRFAPRQPYLHDRVICLASPALWMSPPDGQISDGADGVYVADRRVLSQLLVQVAGEPPAPASGGLTSAASARFVSVVRAHGDPSADPTVTCERDRHATPTGGVEQITVRNRSRRRVTTELHVTVAADLAAISTVKLGAGSGAGSAAGSGADADPVRLTQTDVGLRWSAESGDLSAHLDAAPAPDATTDDTLVWRLDLEPGDAFTATLTLTATYQSATGFRPQAPAQAAPWREQPLTVRADDRRFDELVRQSVADLDALRLGDSDQPEDAYYAAGAPWYLSLFGRDSLWAAQMALPLGTELAAGTLRTLARRQGTRHHAPTVEAPGKIAHELRSADTAVFLPEVYYGTIDATPLFVTTLSEAWRWGMPESEVAALLPAAERALAWLETDGDPDRDGFIEYAADHSGLSNQGWKDSYDGVQWADGRLAEAPLALCEVQAYAYQAAIAGAELLDAFDRPGGQRWREWAQALADRFRATFWVSDPGGPYPAIALDAGKRPVDGPASNIGHLLGTGLLRPEEENLVATRLGQPEFDSGYGLRTLPDTARGFNPLSYQAGSVWPHDTAIAIWGMTRAGYPTPASQLITGLLAAAPHFQFRLPELYGGQRRTDPLPPTPYPASCRPQAWAAAAAPLIVRSLLGLEPDVPAGTIQLDPMTPSPVGAYEVHNIRVGGGFLAVKVDAAGRATVLSSPPGIEVTIAGSS